MALHLDPGNDEVASVMARLFPGKSVKDIMTSRAAAAARTALEHMSTGSGGLKLQPLDHK